MTRRPKPSRSGSALSDHAKVRGVRKGRANRKKTEDRGATRRSARRVLTTAGTVVGLIGLVYGTVELVAWAKVSPRFAIEQVTLDGAARAEQAHLLELAGVRAGDNLVAVDSAAIEERLASHPWVATAEASKRYPRGLELEVVEHAPVVMVALGHLYFANAAGEIVKRYAPGEPADLPVVTGLTRAAIESADPVAQAMLTGAIGFVAAWQSFHGSQAPALAEVHVDPVMGLSAVLEGDEARVAFGEGPWEDKFARWQAVQAALEARGVRASRLTLNGSRRPERVVARLERASGARSTKARTAGKAATSGQAPRIVAATDSEDGR